MIIRKPLPRVVFDGSLPPYSELENRPTTRQTPLHFAVKARDLRMRARTADLAKAREGRGTGPGRNWSASALFDRVFWLGDFNYRLEAEGEDVRRGVELGDKGIAQLLEFDQLLDQAKQSKVAL